MSLFALQNVTLDGQLYQRGDEIPTDNLNDANTKILLDNELASESKPEIPEAEQPQAPERVVPPGETAPPAEEAAPDTSSSAKTKDSDAATK